MIGCNWMLWRNEEGPHPNPLPEYRARESDEIATSTRYTRVIGG
jgi:hypothetical protein